MLHELKELFKALQVMISTRTIGKKKMDELINMMTNEKEGEVEEEADSEKEEYRSKEEEDNSED